MKGTAQQGHHRVLIYRLGSLGDTVVALPSLHLVARTFPNSERTMLTNVPVSQLAAPAQGVLGDRGIVHNYMSYPVGTRSLFSLWRLRADIRARKFDVLVYLAAPRGRLRALRDAMFFLSCGVYRQVGVPWRASMQAPTKLSGSESWESEANRLARCISKLGAARPEEDASWDLRLSKAELVDADSRLAKLRAPRFIAISVGTKAQVKDWGEEKWTELVTRLASERPNDALLLLGAEPDHSLSERVSRGWRGPKLNLCGEVSPRVSAAVLARATLFVGHDSGPMHLAAAVGTQCVAIFSARNLHGHWFPRGDGHQVLYRQLECAGCHLMVCEALAKRCITAISVEDVLEAVRITSTRRDGRS